MKLLWSYWVCPLTSQCIITHTWWFFWVCPLQPCRSGGLRCGCLMKVILSEFSQSCHSLILSFERNEWPNWHQFSYLVSPIAIGSCTQTTSWLYFDICTWPRARNEARPPVDCALMFQSGLGMKLERGRWLGILL